MLPEYMEPTVSQTRPMFLFGYPVKRFTIHDSLLLTNTEVFNNL